MAKPVGLPKAKLLKKRIRGGIQWQIEYPIKDNPRKRVAAHAGVCTCVFYAQNPCEHYRAALDMSKEIQKQLDSGNAVAGEIRLRDFEKEYKAYAESSSLSKQTQTRYLGVFNLFITFCEYRNISLLSQIDRKVIDDYASDLKRRGRKSGTVIVHWICLRSIFATAKRWKLIDLNHWSFSDTGEKSKIVIRDRKTPNYISEQDEILLLKDMSKFWQMFFSLILQTGMRLGEIINLTFRQWHDNFLMIEERSDYKAWRPKSKNRTIPLTDTAKAILQTLLDDELAYRKQYPQNPYEPIGHCYVFRTRSANAISERNAIRYFDKRVKALKMMGEMGNKITIHTLRHTVATRLIQRGATLTSVKIILGHSDESTTQLYVHSSDKANLEIIKLLNN